MQGWGTISEEGSLSPPQALEAGPLGPEGEGMLVGTDQAKMSSHVVMALQWAEDKGA